jgi:hypothetical protein
MRAQTITTMTRQRRQARRRRALALALGVCALAVPAAASASPVDGYSSVNSITGSSNDSSEPIDGWNYELLNSPAGESGQPAADRDDSLYAHPITPNALLGADGLGEPTLVTGSPASADDGFDWASGAVGAAAVMALVALGGAALLAFRRRTTVSPAA